MSAKAVLEELRRGVDCLHQESLEDENLNLRLSDKHVANLNDDNIAGCTATTVDHRYFVQVVKLEDQD